MASCKKQPCFHPSVYQNIQSVYEIFDDNFFTVETQVNAHHPLFVRIEFIKRQFSIEIYTIEMDTIFSISCMTTFVGQWQKCSLLPEYQWTLIENPGKLTNRIYMIIWQQNPSTLYLGLILIIERFWQKYEHTNGTTRHKVHS